MLPIRGKTVLITGASSGIGKATAEVLAMHGANLILAARRKDRLEQIAKVLSDKHLIRVLPIFLDVQNKDQIQQSIDGLTSEWENIDILINNAGLALASDNLQEGNLENWDTMIQTNIQGLLYVTRAILPRMVKRQSGHIVNIGSVAGHDVYPRGNVYCASKHAVRALSKAMRIDLLGLGIRVTEIDPGLVHTEFSEVRWKDKAKADAFYADYMPLQAADIADAICYCLTRPLHVNVSEMVVYPMGQASVNHIVKADQPLESIMGSVDGNRKYRE